MVRAGGLLTSISQVSILHLQLRSCQLRQTVDCTLRFEAMNYVYQRFQDQDSMVMTVPVSSTAVPMSPMPTVMMIVTTPSTAPVSEPD